MSLSRRTVLLGGMGLAVAGCGGGTSVDPATLPRVHPRVAIKWARSTRAFEGPASANYVEIQVRSLLMPELKTSLDFGRIGFPDIDATVRVVELPGELPVGPVELVVRFYNTRNGLSDLSKILVAVAQATVELKAPGGTLADVALEGFLASVAITPGQGVPLQGIGELRFTARDRDGVLIALPQTMGTIEIVEGDGELLAQVTPGRFKGLKEGLAKVRVRVDGVISPPETVEVGWLVPFLEGFLVSHLPIRSAVWDSSRQVFWAVLGQQEDQIVELNPKTRGLGRALTVAGGVHGLTLTPDNQALYFVVREQDAVRRLTLSDMVLRERLTVPRWEVGGLTQPLLRTLPGASNRVLIAWSWQGILARDDVRVYEGETALPSSFQTLRPRVEHVSQISVDENGRYAYLFTSSGGFRVELGPEGLRPETLLPWQWGRYDQGYLVDSRQIFDATKPFGEALLQLPSDTSEIVEDRGIRGRPFLVKRREGHTPNLRTLDRKTLAERGRLTLLEPQEFPSLGNFDQFLTWGERGVAVIPYDFDRGGMLVHPAMPGW